MPLKTKKDEGASDTKLVIKEPFLTTNHVLVVFFVVLIATALAFDIALTQIKSKPIPTCGDGTLHASCSLIKPYFCDQGVLMEKASACGCGDSMKASGDSCISKYSTGENNISFNYTLNGKYGLIDLIVYDGANNYVSKLPKEIYLSAGEQPLKSDFKLKSVDEEQQRGFLLPLVAKIQNKTDDEDDQVRIAISLVQNIPYGFSNKTPVVGANGGINYSRYPYEVLYDNAGICGEKSALLSFILKEMGYKTAFFYYPDENHEAIGIGCPVENSVLNSGYCFIETTGPSIITDDSLEYVGGIILNSEPQIILISKGKSIGKNWVEYKDAQMMKKIRRGFVLFENFKLGGLEKKYGLVREYQAA